MKRQMDVKQSFRPRQKLDNARSIGEQREYVDLFGNKTITLNGFFFFVNTSFCSTFTATCIGGSPTAEYDEAVISYTLP